MYTILFSIQILACFIFYASSKKVKHASQNTWLEKARNHTKIARLLAITLLLITGFVLLIDLGLVSSFFTFCSLLMLGFSLVILLYPYAFVRWKYMLVIFVISLSVEFFFN